MSYTKFPRGSEWRRWDLHIHTPETKKNDQFDGQTSAEKWDSYFKTINDSTEEIAVVGITDYFSIENYFTFKEAISSGKITKSFDLVVPNIELRVSPVTGSAKPINLHCIFNPEIEHEISTRFLARLQFEYAGSTFSATPEDIRRLGRVHTGNQQLNDEGAAKAGYDQYVIEIGTLKTLFKNDKTLRQNTIIVVANSGSDGVSGAVKHSDFLIGGGKTQLDATRYSIYQFSDAIFSSSENDILYFSGNGADSKEDVIFKCAALMPCFHGCDAHENAKIFNPDHNRFCWIKADPTFEGLKQTLYEPEDRVRIQAFKPDIKNDRFIISELSFEDSSNLFGNQTIQLNDNLNAIIGGKSSGKSLLMYSAAKAIDPEQVDRASQRLKFEGYKLPGNFDFKVKWKNGEIDRLNDTSLANKSHKITYIPQLYINHLVEKNNKEDLNGLIENILLQDSEFKKNYEENNSKIDRYTSDIDTALSNYLQTRTTLLDLQQRIKEIGKSTSISAGIESLKKTVEAGKKSSNLNEQEFKDYNTLNSNRTAREALIKALDSKVLVLEEIEGEVQSAKLGLFGSDDPEDAFGTRGAIDRVLDQLNIIPDDVKNIVDTLAKDFSTLSANLKNNIDKIDVEKERAIHVQEIERINLLLKPLLIKIEGQQELQKLIKQLGLEETKLTQSQTLEKQFSTLMNDYSNLRGKIAELLRLRSVAYNSIIQEINTSKSDIGNGITLRCNLIYKQDCLNLFEQANKASISGDHIFYDLFNDGQVVYEKLIDLFSKPLRVKDSKLIYGVTDAEYIPLKLRINLDDVLRGIVEDCFELDYSVTYKNDDLLSMSPGKKGTVLLILFLQISSSEFPILIDQPEDNLDNRTIYDLLCTMIKQKKRDRQIIIVSHNANLVVATDAENIIVANQAGQESNIGNSPTRFAYINGSIEHSFPINTSIQEVLLQQGIKEHACDILEGGDEAFKQRERKYSIK